jgi:hypothetical protein
MHKQRFGDGRLFPSGFFIFYLLPSRKKLLHAGRDEAVCCTCVRGSDQTVGGAFVDKDGKWMDIRIIRWISAKNLYGFRIRIRF